MKVGKLKVGSWKLEVGYRANERKIDNDNEREIVEQVVVQIHILKDVPHGSACLKLPHADFRDTFVILSRAVVVVVVLQVIQHPD